MTANLAQAGRQLVRYRSLVMDSARWAGFEFRPGDIVISTPPKAGTTWMQTICTLLILQDPEPAPPDEVSPWLDMVLRPVDDVLAQLAAQTHRRFIKTHTPLDGLPWDERVTYVCVGRDPRDLALSWDNHLFNIDFDAFFAARERAVGTADLAELMSHAPPPPPSTLKRFWGYMDGPYDPSNLDPNLAFAVHHLASFWAVRDQPNVVLAHYGELSADLSGQMRRLAGALGIEVPEGSWPDLVAAATFDRMKARAGTHTPESTHALWRNKARFFNRGTCGQWRTLLDKNGEARYAARVAELADPALLTWMHCDNPR
jgi:aryl sulfotransferase